MATVTVKWESTYTEHYEWTFDLDDCPPDVLEDLANDVDDAILDDLPGEETDEHMRTSTCDSRGITSITFHDDPEKSNEE